jgi:hypothetical protein
MHASGIGRLFRHSDTHGGKKMSVFIPFLMYGILAGCVTALAGYIALRLCGMSKPPLITDSYPFPSVSEPQRAGAR